jgi:acyl-CoA dehydrogenase family protein 9
VLSRVTAAIESKGAEAAADEIAIAKVFAGQARGRISRNFRKIDDNDDELIKELAVHTYERGGYPWDAV